MPFPANMAVGVTYEELLLITFVACSPLEFLLFYPSSNNGNSERTLCLLRGNTIKKRKYTTGQCTPYRQFYNKHY